MLPFYLHKSSPKLRELTADLAALARQLRADVEVLATDRLFARRAHDRCRWRSEARRASHRTGHLTLLFLPPCPPA